MEKMMKVAGEVKEAEEKTSGQLGWHVQGR